RGSSRSPKRERGRAACLCPEGALDNSPGRKPWVKPAYPTNGPAPKGRRSKAPPLRGVTVLGHGPERTQGFRPGLLSSAPSGRRRLVHLLARPDAGEDVRRPDADEPVLTRPADEQVGRPV